MRKKHTRRAASEVEKTSRPRLAIDRFQRSLTWWHRDRTRKMIERSAVGECPSSWHVRSQPVTSRTCSPYNVVRLLTSHYNYRQGPNRKFKTGPGAEAQDQAGPAKAVSRSRPQTYCKLCHYEDRTVQFMFKPFPTHFAHGIWSPRSLNRSAYRRERVKFMASIRVPVANIVVRPLLRKDWFTPHLFPWPCKC